MRAVNEALAQAVKEQEEGLLNCVHCGFCLPACPTYRRLGDEADSPRGRLHLMRAVTEGRLDPGSDAYQIHIDRCLACRACEPVCPSGVAYGHLLELARAAGREARRPALLSRLLLRVFGTRWLAGPAMFGARLFRATGIPALAARLPLGGDRPGAIRLGMAMLAASARRRPPPRPGPRSAPPPGPAAAPRPPAAAPPLHRPTRVAVLTGCVQAGLFARVNSATVRVLEANGYEVVPAPGQGCCGALHAHAGDLVRAAELARHNVEAFEASGADHIAVNASGCGAAMADYGSLLAADDRMGVRAEEVAGRVLDVSQLLARRGPVPGGDLPMSVTYDPPCHLLHARGVSGPPEAVLKAVPGVEIVPLAGAGECCGGAGIYGLTHQQLGGWIGGDKVRSVIDSGAAALVTGNPGCMMQIGAGLRLAGRATPVLHVVEVLDESYDRGGLYRKAER